MSNFLNIEILAIFEISNGNFYILVEFESDRMSPRESAKNGRFGAYGLISKTF